MAKRMAKPTDGEGAVRKRRRGRPQGQAKPAQADSNAVPSTVALNGVLPAETEQEVEVEVADDIDPPMATTVAEPAPAAYLFPLALGEVDPAVQRLNDAAMTKVTQAKPGVLIEPRF